MKFNELRIEMMKFYSSAVEHYSNEEYQQAYEDMMNASKICKQLADISYNVTDAHEYKNLQEHYYDKALAYLDMSGDPKKKGVFPVETPTQGFSDFIGLDKEKKYLEDTIIKPWKENTLYEREKNGLFLYGPHGVGKTRFAHSLIKELHAKAYFFQPLKHFRMTDFPDVEYSFRKVFDTIENENNVVLFMESPVPYFSNGEDDFSKDTCDLFMRLFRNELKRIRKKKLNVLFIATTSAPDKINPKAFGNELFDDFLRVRIPDDNTRFLLIQRYFKDFKLTSEEEKELMDKTQGFVTSDISRLSKEILENNALEKKDFDAHLENFVKEDISEYEKNITEFENMLRLSKLIK